MVPEISLYIGAQEIRGYSGRKILESDWKALKAANQNKDYQVRGLL